ncbi:MAG: DNA repair protein RecN [Ruminococcaceae bacterium]|nr:DNA repair protein RecN [Oscillospiraceae bacterium]
MLKYLHIENIAVIERSEIEFKNGFNVLTGETGAGKSIVIDSINAVLGERTSKDLIRNGCDSAEVSALFGDFSDETIEFLKCFDVFPDEDGNVLITRKLSLAGKGLIKINGKPFTASVLREIASALINIHGQHDNQDLLNPEKHVSFIDAVAQNENEISEYYSEFKNLNKIRKELVSLEEFESDKERKTELLKYQINELETANIKIGEIEELKHSLEIAENYESVLKGFTAASQLLSGDSENDGALTLLKNAYKSISGLKSNEFDSFALKLSEIISLTEDSAANISGYLDSLDASNLDVNSINGRLDFLQRLMLKYGGSEEKMLEFLSDAKLQLQNIEGYDKRIGELSKLLEESKLKLISLAEILTETRIKAAQNFEREVCEVLSYLNMPNVKFVVDIKGGRYTKNGCDNVEFLISANLGENLKPLSKIASGGELSRIMLSIKSSLLGRDNVETMIFDEIDTGISGFAAERTAAQLKKVSKNTQVICVTHLAQIAAKADNHLLISKSSNNGRTYTEVTPLDYDGKIKEISRIMSGSDITENIYNSAKEMIDRS